MPVWVLIQSRKYIIIGTKWPLSVSSDLCNMDDEVQKYKYIGIGNTKVHGEVYGKDRSNLTVEMALIIISFAQLCLQNKNQPKCGG